MENKKTKGLLLGSIVASIFASACCIGPIIFAVLGLSSAGLLSKFDPYRGLISSIAIIMLATSFYFTYRKKPAEECKTDSLCANPKSDIWNKRILWVATIIVLAVLTFPQWSLLLV
jgi:mercuric ion transport protein